MFRVGCGYDAHRLVHGRDLILGGVHIAHPTGLDGHSDADVLIHAIIDALLGAAGLNDIGEIFPDTSEDFKGISGITLLDYVRALLDSTPWYIANIDATIIAQEPKLGAYKLQMRQNIADALGLDIDTVTVKATTEEHMGFTGRREGIAAYAVCLMYE